MKISVIKIAKFPECVVFECIRTLWKDKNVHVPLCFYHGLLMALAYVKPCLFKATTTTTTQNNSVLIRSPLHYTVGTFGTLVPLTLLTSVTALQHDVVDI